MQITNKVAIVDFLIFVISFFIRNYIIKQFVLSAHFLLLFIRKLCSVSVLILSYLKEYFIMVLNYQMINNITDIAKGVIIQIISLLYSILYNVYVIIILSYSDKHILYIVR